MSPSLSNLGTVRNLAHNSWNMSPEGGYITGGYLYEHVPPPSLSSQKDRLHVQAMTQTVSYVRNDRRMVDFQNTNEVMTQDIRTFRNYV